MRMCQKPSIRSLWAFRRQVSIKLQKMRRLPGNDLPPNKRCSGPVLLSSWVQIASLRSVAPKMPVPSLCSGRTGR
jgi:hypothetical protein